MILTLYYFLSNLSRVSILFLFFAKNKGTKTKKRWRVVMNGKAVILAGGFGRRLLPLTEDIPKPLLPMGDSTVYGLMVKRLCDFGFTDISVATMYKAEQIEAYPTEGVTPRFFRESSPLGTAGCVKNAAFDIKESFLVVSGDTVCDFNFGDIMEKHRKSGAPVSVVCVRVNTPTEYGTVLAEEGAEKTE